MWNLFIYLTIPFFILFLIPLIIYYIIQKENFVVSYTNPWTPSQGIPYNWWRRWYRTNPVYNYNFVRPVCPSGCIYTGGNGSGFKCMNSNLCYGEWCCRYDSDCSNCNSLPNLI